jgi:PAS domain S-box-containing protein
MLHELRRAGFDPDWQRVDVEPDYLRALETSPDLILSDWSLPQFSGRRALQIMQERKINIPFIIVSGSMGEDIAVGAMREGATDYLLKDRLARLGEAARRALKEKFLWEERIQIEKKLSDSEQKFRSLVEQSSEGIVIIDEQGKIVDWNGRQEQITGIKRADVIGRPLWEVQFQMVPEEVKRPEIPARLKQAILTLLETGHSPRTGQELETVIELPDGIHRTIQMTTYQIKTEKGFMAGSISRDITESKQAEKEIHELARFPSENTNPVMRIAHNGKLLYANNAALLQMKDLKLELGKPVPEVLRKPAQEVLEAQKGTTIDVPCNGHIFSVSFAPAPKGEDVNLYARDITDRKRAEEKLSESEERFRSLYENATIGMYRTSPDGSILLANPALVSMLGYDSFEELSQRDLALEGYEPGYPRLEFKRSIEQEGEVRGLESAWKRKEGSFIFVRESAHLVRDEKNQALYYEGTVEDISERKRAEEALQQSEAELRALFASMDDAVMVIDRKGVYRKFAPTNTALLFKPPEELLGKPLEEVFPPNQAKTLVSVIQKVVDTKQPTRVEYDLPIGDHTVKFETAISPLTEDSTLWVAHDITARKQAEEQIIRLNAELEQRVEERTHELRMAQEKIVRQEKLAMLGQLAGGVGHELRNPLGIISNAVYYLKLIQPDADEKVRHYHSMIAREVQTSEKIITDLMDFARLESMERSQVSVAELVQWTLMRFTVPESIKTTLKLPEDLPEVFVDMGQMQQVLGNIVDNACQAIIPPGIPNAKPRGGRITISARKIKGMVAISVKDSGEGITPENMARIFEPLFTTKSKGIGLGLAVSKKLAEANGGRIEAKSELGKGSTFTLYLPVGEAKK